MKRFAALFILSLATGCGRPAPSSAGTETPSAMPMPTLESLATAHWIGTDRIAADTNSIAAREITALPETQRLVAQTLDKLSAAPWNWRHIAVDAKGSASVKLFFSEVLKRESRLEFATTANGTAVRALAVRVESSQTPPWATGLLAAAESAIGKRPTPLPDKRPGWILALNPSRTERSSSSPQQLVFAHLNNWIVLGVAPDLSTFDAIAKRVATSDAQQTNFWLAGMVDFPKLERRLSIPTNLFSSYPKADFKFGGSEGKTETSIRLNFARPLDLNLKPWLVPTNLIDHGVVSFSALRGLDQLLGASPAWQKLKFQSAPDQLFVWGLPGDPSLTFLAAHDADPARFVRRASELLVPNGESWATTNNRAGFKVSPDHELIEWNGLPFLWPFLRPMLTNNEGYVLGGTFVFPEQVQPISPSFYKDAIQPDDLVYYSWENTGVRIRSMLPVTQFARYVSGKAQLPDDSYTLLWLNAIQPKVGQSVTKIHLAQPNQLQLLRSSAIGFTAIELHLLADWLESPEFPRGLNTMLGTPR